MICRVFNEIARMNQKRKAALLSGTTIACGALGFVLLMWTPKTGNDILVYAVLLAVLAITAMVLFPPKEQRARFSRRPPPLGDLRVAGDSKAHD